MNAEGKLLRPRLKFERDFTQLPNEWLRDPRLSFKARGLLAMLMTHSEGWSITIKKLASDGPDGASAVRAAVGELEQAGYLTRQQTRTQRGQLSHVNWIVTDPSEQANVNGAPLFDYPTAENRTTVEKPTAENRTTIEEQLKNTYKQALDVTTDARKDNEDGLPAGSHSAASYERSSPRMRAMFQPCPNRSHGKQHARDSEGTCAYCGLRAGQYWIRASEAGYLEDLENDLLDTLEERS